MSMSTIDTEMRILTKAKPFLTCLNRSPLDLAMDINNFGNIQGPHALDSMERFIDKSLSNPSIIAPTLAHDLYNCEKPCFTPRSSNY